jgi:hypothetical protein
MVTDQQDMGHFDKLYHFVGEMPMPANLARPGQARRCLGHCRRMVAIEVGGNDDVLEEDKENHSHGFGLNSEGASRSDTLII